MKLETSQRVIRRNWIFWRLLLCLIALAGLLFVYAIIQRNLAASAKAPDTGPIEILDIQSATSALLATAGALLARAQYATAVRPMLGFQGRSVGGLSPDNDQLVWASRVTNGAQDAATVSNVRYCVRYVGQSPAAVGMWLEIDSVVMELERVGLRTDVDYGLVRFGNGFPLPGGQHSLLGWFTPHAMTVIDALGVRLQVMDRVGDVHERSMDMLKGANRTPQQAALDW